MTVWQRPAKQVCPAAQRTPQALQFSGSTATFTQAPLQQVEPGEQAGPMPQPSGRTHAPARHTVPATQATPQPPQLRGSSPVATHAPPQHACPAAHAGPAPQPAVMQRPSEQVCPVRHATPQPPQLKGSARVETQRSPQHTVGRPQVGMPPQPMVSVQRPATHCCPAAQATPHAPQFAGSLCALTQRSPQHVAPGAHAGPPPQVGITWHRRPLQNSPGAQVLPHAPQFKRFDSMSVHTPPQQPSFATQNRASGQSRLRHAPSTHDCPG
jgi:hypothetical protein